jgi:hypothetical protein
MLTKSQQHRIARKATEVVIKAMDEFPDLLRQCEAEEAAKIVAGVIRAHMAKAMPEPVPDEPDEGETLTQMVERLATEDAAEPPTTVSDERKEGSTNDRHQIPEEEGTQHAGGQTEGLDECPEARADG